MSEIDPDPIDDLEEQITKGERRERVHFKKRKRPGPTASDRESRSKEIRAIRAERAKEAETKIRNQLLNLHFSVETKEERERTERYIGWVEDSLRQGYPDLKEQDIAFETTVASKPGGQHRQKRRSAARAIHIPTGISVRNEEQRSLEQNKVLATAGVLRSLEDHLNLWQTMVKNAPAPIAVGKEIMDMLGQKEG